MKSAVRTCLMLLLGSAAAATLWWTLRHWPARWWRADLVAECRGHIVTIADVQAGLRDHLWCRALEWQDLSEQERTAIRGSVLANLIQRRLLRLHRLTNSNELPAAIEVAGEFDLWRRQFQPDAERTLRMGRQRLKDADMEKLIDESLADQRSLELAVRASMKPLQEHDLREWYDHHAETLRVPAATRVAHLYLTRHEREKPNREPEIRELHRRLAQGEATFADLCSKHSEDERTKARGGDLGWCTPSRMPMDFMAALAKLSVGQTSEPVLTKLGWHILKIQERKPSRIPAFEEVRHEIEAHLLSKRRSAAVDQKLEEIARDYEDELWRAEPAVLNAIEPAAIH